MNWNHGGDVFRFARLFRCGPQEVTDFSANINPLGMSPLAIKAIQETVSRVVHYPDPKALELREALAESHGLEPDQILVGNGSTELIHLLPRALAMRKVLIPVPTFSEYERAGQLAGSRISFLRLREQAQFQMGPPELIRAMTRGVDAVFLCNPNNPTGHLLEPDEIHPLIEEASKQDILVILDEAFIEYAEQASMIREIRRYPHLIVLRSFSKFYGMPGLRVGYLAARPGVIRRLEKWKPPWSANTLALEAARMSLMDFLYIKHSREVVEVERASLERVLSGVPGLTVFPSHANYLLLKLALGHVQMETLARTLGEEKILVRDCRSFRGLGHRYIRIAVRSRPENQRLVELLTGEASR